MSVKNTERWRTK